jgi:hypothetical protein
VIVGICVYLAEPGTQRSLLNRLRRDVCQVQDLEVVVDKAGRGRRKLEVERGRSAWRAKHQHVRILELPPRTTSTEHPMDWKKGHNRFFQAIKDSYTMES